MPNVTGNEIVSFDIFIDQIILKWKQLQIVSK